MAKALRLHRKDCPFESDYAHYHSQLNYVRMSSDSRHTFRTYLDPWQNLVMQLAATLRMSVRIGPDPSHGAMAKWLKALGS